MGGISFGVRGVLSFKRISYGIASNLCNTSILVGFLLRYRRLASIVRTILKIIGRRDRLCLFNRKFAP